ncbi:MAG: aspartate aminotransferase family protein, partial [Clostridiales bacterium]|nr:aspartate aminotransferase family protein [Clostridiales bacterium]
GVIAICLALVFTAISASKNKYAVLFSELDAQDAMTCDIERFNKYFKALLEEGVLIGPAQFEAMFLSTAHTKEDLDKALEAMGKALRIAHQ